MICHHRIENKKGNFHCLDLPCPSSTLPPLLSPPTYSSSDFFFIWEMASQSSPVPKLRTSQSSLLFHHIIDPGSNNFQITFLFLTLISTVPGTWYAFNKWELLEYTLQQGPLLQPTVLTSPVAVSSHAHCTVRCFLDSLSNSDFAQARSSLWAVFPNFSHRWTATQYQIPSLHKFPWYLRLPDYVPIKFSLHF